MIGTAITLGVLGAAGWNAALGRSYRVDFGADRRLTARTEDGWNLAIWRYGPRGPTRTHPVLLCPGLSSNRYSFDLGPDAPSLARTLAGQGFEVFVVELRGYGQSLRGRRRFGWGFDDYLRRDVPALIDEIRAATGAERLHWVGHSMGGIIALSHLARGGGFIRSATTVGSCLDYSQSKTAFHMGLRAKGLLRLVPAVPLGPVVRQIAPLSSRFATPFEEFNVWLPNIDRTIGRRLNAVTFHEVSSPVYAELATALEPGGLRSPAGERYLERLSRLGHPPPVFLLSGDRDRQCPPDAVDRTARAIAGAEVLHLGPQTAAGTVEHYGHFDLLMGLHVEREVFPSIVDWLIRHDRPRG